MTEASKASKRKKPIAVYQLRIEYRDMSADQAKEHAKAMAAQLREMPGVTLTTSNFAAKSPVEEEV